MPPSPVPRPERPAAAWGTASAAAWVIAWAIAAVVVPGMAGAQPVRSPRRGRAQAADRGAPSADGRADLGAGARLTPEPAHSSDRVQVTSSLDVAGALVTYDGYLRSAVGTLTPALRVETARTSFLARGAYSRFESGREALQATIGAAYLTPAVWLLRGEFAGSASATHYDGGPGATSLSGTARLHVATPQGGAWMGSSGGFVAERQLFPDDLLQLDVGFWRRIGASTYTLVVAPTSVGRVRYVDVTAGLRWQGAIGEFGASGGYRGAERPAALPGVERWVEGWATYWLGGRTALVGGVGVFPAELVQALPGGRYASLGVRVATRRPALDDPALRAELMLPYELGRLRRVGEVGVVVVTNVDGTRTLRLRVPGARQVELMGDFTDWTAVSLARGADARWEVTLPLAPGVHRMNVRVDGGEWTVPPGLTSVDDGFGGVVGLLVVQ